MIQATVTMIAAMGVAQSAFRGTMMTIKLVTIDQVVKSIIKELKGGK